MKYFGTKSLDAEMYLDLIKGEIRMDYSSNDVFSNYESNSSTKRNDGSWWEIPSWKRIFLNFIIPPTHICLAVVMACVMPTTVFLTKHELFPASWHYPYQNFLKWAYRTYVGVYEEIYEGELFGTVLQCPVSRNIWFGYELSGDYEKYIINISFERRLLTFKKFNEYTVTIQNGWMLTFIFSQPPKTGSCKVEYV